MLEKKPNRRSFLAGTAAFLGLSVAFPRGVLAASPRISLEKKTEKTFKEKVIKTFEYFIKMYEDAMGKITKDFPKGVELVEESLYREGTDKETVNHNLSVDHIDSLLTRIEGLVNLIPSFGEYGPNQLQDLKKVNFESLGVSERARMEDFVESAIDLSKYDQGLLNSIMRNRNIKRLKLEEEMMREYGDEDAKEASSGDQTYRL